MARKTSSAWTTISLYPMTGVLDVRSRPADVPTAGFRWKLNVSATPEGKLCRRDGWQKARPGMLYDATTGNPVGPDTNPEDVVYHNHDHHHRGRTRLPITMLQEINWSDGTRTLFDGDFENVSMLDETTGYWTDIITGVGSEGQGTVWRGGVLQDVVLFTNGLNDIYAWDKSLGGAATTVPELVSAGVQSAKVIASFNGFILLMNLQESGKPYLSRVRWCDLNGPKKWTVGAVDSLAGFQDLDYGDEILGAAELLSSLYIFTRRAIWKCSVAATSTNVFSFTRVYREAKNQTGCLAFPYTLVSTGLDLFYLSRDGIYRYNPYVPQPVRDDWLHRSSGLIFTKADTRMSGILCFQPCAEYRPGKRELWFSWASTTAATNNYTMVAQLDQTTADLVDEGFTAFTNFRSLPAANALCNEIQSFFAASGTDYCIKEWGGVFYREYAELDAGGVGVDLPLDGLLYRVLGYNTQLRGLVPTGFMDREKDLRSTLLDHATAAQDVPCAVRCRIGNSYHLVDPNEVDDLCAPVWRHVTVERRDLGGTFADPLLKCPDPKAISEMAAKGERPSDATIWPMYETGRFLWFEITVMNQDGSPGIGGDSCMERVDFDVTAEAKE